MYSERIEAKSGNHVCAKSADFKLGYNYLFTYLDNFVMRVSTYLRLIYVIMIIEYIEAIEIIQYY